MQKKSKTNKVKGRKHIFLLGFAAGICSVMLFNVIMQNDVKVVSSEKEQVPETFGASHTKQETSKQETKVQTSVILDVPYINQRERYPTGCESISTVMALNYLGIDITADRFIDNYLDTGTFPSYNGGGSKVGCDPWKAFPGNPYSEYGYGCFAPVIIKALDKFIDKNKYDIRELYNVSIDELCRKYIDNGIPVIFWATAEMNPTRQSTSWTDEDTGKIINWISPMHCLLLVGYDDASYYFNDPRQSKAYAYQKNNVEKAYKGMFSQSVVISPKSN